MSRLKLLACLLTILAAALLALLIDSPPSVIAHGGGLDRYGCHRDTKAGTYHCHRGSCVGMTFKDQAEMLKAKCYTAK